MVPGLIRTDGKKGREEKIKAKIGGTFRHQCERGWDVPFLPSTGFGGD
jgi:hypothetical protein